MFYWEAKKGKFPVEKWSFVKTDPHCSVVLLKTNVFLLNYCKLKTNFTAKSQLLYMGCPLTRECKQTKEKSNFHFQKYPRPAYKRVSVYGNV